MKERCERCGVFDTLNEKQFNWGKERVCRNCLHLCHECGGKGQHYYEEEVCTCCGGSGKEPEEATEEKEGEKK